MISVWKGAAWLTKVCDRLLNMAIFIALIAALLYGGFGVWDTYKIYEGATLDSELLKYKPTDSGKDTPNPTLSDMQKINPDVCAWLTVDDTNIDYPVIQGETNVEYLNQAIDKSFSLSGSIFLDYRNAFDFSDRYTLIYGHHMEGEVMFGELPYFLEDDYFESHQTGVVFTPAHTYHITWFACLETDAYDNYIYDPTVYGSDEKISELLVYLKKNSTQYRDIGVDETDRLVALSTCAAAATNGRVILVGRIS
jgi:sortase B